MIRRLICAASHVKMKEFAELPWPHKCARCLHWYGPGSGVPVTPREQRRRRRQQWRDQAVGWGVVLATAPLWIAVALLGRSAPTDDS